MSFESETMTNVRNPKNDSSNDLLLTFASPAQIFYNQSKNVRQIHVPTLAGSLTIQPNHHPLVAVLKPGVVSVVESDGNTKRIFVSSGSIAVHNGCRVQLLAEEATSLENLDRKACEDALADAQRHYDLAKDEKEKAEAQIEIDCAQCALQACSDLSL